MTNIIASVLGYAFFPSIGPVYFLFSKDQSTGKLIFAWIRGMFLSIVIPSVDGKFNIIERRSFLTVFILCIVSTIVYFLNKKIN